MGTRVVSVAASLAVALCTALVAWTATMRSGESPRAPNRQPDLQGVWQTLNMAAWNIQDHSEERYPGLPARFSMPAGQGIADADRVPAKHRIRAHPLREGPHLPGGPDDRESAPRCKRAAVDGRLAWPLRGKYARCRCHQSQRKGVVRSGPAHCPLAFRIDAGMKGGGR